ncbi:P2Y purinoceptor 1-like isoform X2 [Gambusia affinis]|uniref:P2Y purinoceptor 1-like isoform X2 n=1 Tax=Gambusia affinis TaxID=33528 RepID=UPI001CDBC678|nr:P2Y purinoceptor 1-like isoform X2 [Gambusia affinis]
MNKINCSPPDKDLFEHRVLPALYISVFVIGLVLNVWGMKSLLHNWKKFQHINIFVLNLGLADIMYLLTLPFLIVYRLKGNKWMFGDRFCKVTRFCYNLNLYGSIGFLTCISVYRYLAVVHPIRTRGRLTTIHSVVISAIVWILETNGSLEMDSARYLSIVHPMRTLGKLTTTHSVVISAIVWILVSVQSLPDMFYPKTYPNGSKCFDTTSNEHINSYLDYTIAWTIFGFCIPFVTIVGCYGHVTVVICRSNMMKKDQKRQILKLMALLILLFSLCYAPYHIFKNLSLYSRVLRKQGTCPQWDSGVFIARQFRQLLRGGHQIFIRRFKSKSSSVPVPQAEQEVEMIYDSK